MINHLKLIEDKNIIAWILANNIKTERGVPLDFEDFSFMIDPYLDWTPDQGTRKCTQIGWSVMTNVKLFYAAKFGIPEYNIPAANVIYTLPSDRDVSDFVPSKTNLLIENNPTIRSYLRDEDGNMNNIAKTIDSIQRKRVGNSMIYFKGTRSKTAALMLSSDLNIHDESDRSEADIIDQYGSRLDQSKYKGGWVFSNPSVPNMPADLKYQESDQKHWFVSCEHCGHWQYLAWVKLSEHEFSKAHHCYVDDTYERYVCGKCAMPLSDDTRRRGRWIKKYRNRNTSGYWVSHMMCAWKNVGSILDMELGKMRDGKGAKSKQYMHNFVFGLPYVGSEVVVDESVIVNNIVLDKIQWERGRVAMGIDNGDRKWYVIGDERGIWEYGSTESWDDIEALIQKYDPFYVVDLNPYPNEPRKLTKKYRKGRASFYVDDQKTMELFEMGKVGTDKGYMVYPNRERVITRLIEYIHDGQVRFYGAKAKWEEYISHWETLYQATMVGSKIILDDDLANEEGLRTARKVWLSSTGKDHLVHATVYWFVAMHRLLTGAGVVLGGTSIEQQVKQVLGPIQRAPARNPETGNQIQRNTFIPTLKKSGRRDAAISATIK